MPPHRPADLAHVDGRRVQRAAFSQLRATKRLVRPPPRAPTQSPARNPLTPPASLNLSSSFATAALVLPALQRRPSTPACRRLVASLRSRLAAPHSASASLPGCVSPRARPHRTHRPRRAPPPHLLAAHPPLSTPRRRSSTRPRPTYSTDATRAGSSQKLPRRRTCGPPRAAHRRSGTASPRTAVHRPLPPACRNTHRRRRATRPCAGAPTRAGSIRSTASERATGRQSRRCLPLLTRATARAANG